MKDMMDSIKHVENEPPGSNEKEKNFFGDGDSCTAFELEQSFQEKYKIADESAGSLKKDYIIRLCSDSSCSRLVAGFSNGVVQIFDINQQKLSRSCIPDGIAPEGVSSKHIPNICGVCFLDETPNNLLIGTANSLIRLYDLRANEEQARFEAKSDSHPKRCTYTTFDRNSNSRIICVGTEETDTDEVYLLFYDVRQCRLLGGYSNSHDEVVTDVRFHGVNPDILCSGSNDGLINIFNIAEQSEDDALQTTINVMNSVHKLSWHKNVFDQDTISCITQSNDFKLYDEEGDSVVDIERPRISEAMRRKAPANCNLVGCHSMDDGSVFLLAGTNLNKGEILRSLYLHNKELQPLANFEGNKQIVRESIFDAKSKVLITAGEGGIVTLWSPRTMEETSAGQSSSRKLKSKTHQKSSKSTPY